MDLALDAIGEGAALVDQDRRLATAELRSAVTAEAAWLRSRNGKRLGLLADNGCPWVIADLAAGMAGLVTIPLPGWFTPRQLQFVMADGALDLILTDEPDRIQMLVPAFRRVGQGPGSGLVLLARPAPALEVPLPPATAKVTYTSGSTGAPKGVCMGATAIAQVTRSLATVTRELGARRHLCLLPLPTLLENIAGVYTPLLAGGECSVPGLETTGMSYGKVDGRLLTAAIARWRPETLILVPELLRLLLAAVGQGWSPPDCLRFIAVGGAAVSPVLLDQADAAGLPVYEGYGLSECASVVCLNTPGARRRGSVGRPLPHARIRVDAEGEIHVDGAVYAGYLGDTRPPPREVATGDLGQLDSDGFLHLKGRRRNLIVTSLGRNVSPEWVEGELHAEPAIAQAVVLGEARPWIVALITPAGPDRGEQDVAAAVARANSRLPDYARIRGWALLDEPLSLAAGTLTANGRPRRTAIAARHGQLIDSLYSREMEVS